MHLRKDPKGKAPRPRLSMKMPNKKTKASKQQSINAFAAIGVKITRLEQELETNELKANQVCSSGSGEMQWYYVILR